MSVETLYAARLSLLDEVASELERLTEDAIAPHEHGHVDRVTFRAKGVVSFLKKARGEGPSGKVYPHALRDIEDQVAGRVLVFFRHDIDDVVGWLESAFLNVEASRKAPDSLWEFGYESDHLICLIPDAIRPTNWQDHEDMPSTFELQVRTLFMHAWAEPQHDLIYKPKTDVPDEVKRDVAWAAASAWGSDRTFEAVYQRLAAQDRSDPDTRGKS